MVLFLTAFQVESPDVILHITIEHGLPKLDVGPYKMFLHTAVGKLGDPRAEFLGKQKRKCIRRSGSCN